MTPAVFQELLAAQRVPQSGGASLSDGRGLTIARAVAEGPFLGERVSEDLGRAMAAAPEGFREGRTREGREVLFAYSRSPISGWTAAIGVARSDAFAAVWEATTRLVMAAAALLLLGIAVAAWMARSVARPLDRLAAAAEAIERGAPVGLTPMHGEFSRLARALQAAHRAIAEREHERTLRAQAESDRRAAEQASAAKDRFLAMLSHELRNPLAAIANCATLLQRGSGAGEDRAPLVDILVRQSAQLRVLVDDLLDLARITHGKLPCGCAPSMPPRQPGRR
jgi:signal transduction histidine kinase